MSNGPDDVIRRFRERVKSGNIADDLKVSHRISGGMPSQRFDEELELRGGGQAMLSSLDAFAAPLPGKASASLPEAEVRELFEKIEAGLDGLVPRSKARFLPLPCCP